jgi:hypothetical protein
MSKWQPISTAPEDVLILVYDPLTERSQGGLLFPSVAGFFVARYCSGYERWESDLVEFESGWESTGSYNMTATLNPTHWMPLPEPPT